MDFGLEGFLDKFEEHFGKLLTKALVLLIALAVVSVCVGLIWHYLISPVLQFFEASGPVISYSSIVGAGVSLGVGTLLAQRFYISRLNRRMRQMTTNVFANIRQIEEITARLEGAMREARETLPNGTPKVD